ncbi:hypothetical protein CUS80_00350 [Enterococcus faecium]|uniref:hypothetical protein n=1 Tax=Enterococcus faecium TaxID=1352 RepID=UPI000CF3215C|nr:hypothetical protein [Enterococcus faecium]PQG48422.1 hypothetical protein CUS80_00350 [Enterococcus faecium]
MILTFFVNLFIDRPYLIIALLIFSFLIFGGLLSSLGFMSLLEKIGCFLSLSSFFFFGFVMFYSWNILSDYEDEVRKELVEAHYILPKKIQSNMNPDISIKRIYKNGKIDFCVDLVSSFKKVDSKYIEGEIGGSQSKFQIVDSDKITFFQIVQFVEKENVPLYSLDFSCASFGKVKGAEGMTTDNKVVEVKFKEENQLELTIGE